MKLRLAVFLSLVGISSIASAQQTDVFIYNGFMKGEGYLKLPEVQRSVYVMGIVDGFLFAPGFGAPSENVQWLQSCTSGMTNTQITAVVDQYVRSNPIEWQYPVHMLANNALRQACPPTSRGSNNSFKPTPLRGVGKAS